MHTSYSVQNQFSICSRGPCLSLSLPSGPGEKMVGGALTASEARAWRCCHLPHLPGRFHADAQVCFVTLAFLAGIKEMVGESSPHSKPLGQATMVGLETQSYIQISVSPSTYKSCGPGGSLPLSVSLSIPVSAVLSAPSSSSLIMVIFSAAWHPLFASQPFYSKKARLRRWNECLTAGNVHSRDILSVNCE